MSGCRIGAGLRREHYADVLKKPSTPLRWFEVISENFMDTEGRPMAVLESVRRDYPVSLHGVSMSIASADGFQRGYLQRLRRLADRIDPFIVSDHLAWTRTSDGQMHDLLPVPFTQEALALVVARIQQAQETLGRQIALENVSSYLTYPRADFTEWDFLIEVARRAGCRLLFDVNNVYVNAMNHGYDPKAFIDAVPPGLIAQVHLAGFSDQGTHLFDTHSTPVAQPVWDLFERLAPRLGDTPVMIEWDEQLPAFSVLEAEAVKAATLYDRARKTPAQLSPGRR